MNSKIIETLESKNVKPTPMRMLVLEQFLKTKHAQTLSNLEKDLSHSDRITVYRTLKTFVKQGILHTVEDGSGATKYALCPDECVKGHHLDTHPHFSCLKCGDTFCLEDFNIMIPEPKTSLEVHEVHVSLKGLCVSCKEKEEVI
ncbi:Fur family transcriptional regulator [Xanthovirga aplysinae]|uniref:Fur family transcriptional regulator n=1 Tax=Xanthovirga aplysinae TaxID=2529853 RepID=UPI0012BC95DF|nr:transcriptional repressor [Xanthovirga aplysinae]MTI31226.1 transcriptional repressor [Xanthovirga aplysinae]